MVMENAKYKIIIYGIENEVYETLYFETKEQLDFYLNEFKVWNLKMKIEEIGQ